MGIFDVFKPVPPPAPPPVSKPKILLVEDEPLIRDSYQEILASEGYVVVTATQGEEGLTMATQHKPDLILLDIQMPVMDGMTMFKRLKENPAINAIPVVFLTNAGSIDNIKEAVTYNNAAGFLIKANASPEEILKKVKEILGKS